MRFSISALMNSSCRKRFKFSREVDRGLIPEHAPSAKGKGCHDILAKYIEHLHAAGRPQDLTMARAMVDDLRFQLPDPEDYLDIAFQLATFMEYLIINPKVDEYFIEVKRAFKQGWIPCDWDDKDAWFRMIADYETRIDRKLKIQDWKTQMRFPTRTEIERSLQMPSYGVCEGVTFPGVTEFEVALEFVRWARQSSMTLNRADLEKPRRGIEKWIANIEMDTIMKAAPSEDHCHYCDFTLLCDEYIAAVKAKMLEIISTPEQAAQVAREFGVLGIEYEKRKKQLEMWVNQNGPVAVDDSKLQYVVTPTYDIDTTKAVRELLSLGITQADLAPYMRLTKTDIQKILKGTSKNDIEAIVKKCSEESVKNCFKFVKNSK